MPKLLEQNIGVVAITSLFHPYYGGAEKQLERLAEALTSRGVKFYVLTRRLNGLKAFEFLHSVPVYRVFATCISSSLLSTLTFIISSCAFFVTHPNITRRVRILQADSDSPGLVAVVVGKFLRKKVIIRMRGTRQLESIRGSLFLRTVFGIVSKLSDAIIVEYDQVHDLGLMGIDDSKIIVIPSGVDIEYFEKSNNEIRERLREKMGFKNSVIALYVGRLDPVKGLDILVRAFSSVIITHPQLKLVLVGSGSHESYLKNMAETLRTSIVFAGATQNVKDYYEVADIFVLPSRSEGISSALLEAMAMELAVIATALGGTPEVVEDMRNGYLISPSSKEILDKLNLLIKDEQLRNRLGKAARKTVVTNFSMEKIAEKYVELYTCLR